jgi:hypothetical protein
MQEKASVFDSNNAIKHEVNIALATLKDFRKRYAFTENLQEIEWLDPDRLFKLNPDQIGDFFIFIENFLKPFSNSTKISYNVYRNARLQIKEFKNLLRKVVDDRTSLAEKIDAPWERIGGFGQNKTLTKKIIYCFNFEKQTVLPIFSNHHMRHFTNCILDFPIYPTKHASTGQEYQHYTTELLKAKNNFPLTQTWNNLYFTRFLYNAYAPPDIYSSPAQEQRKSNIVTEEQLDLQGFMKLLGELQKQQKITGEQFRENRSLWMQHPDDREALAKRLRRQLNP